MNHITELLSKELDKPAKYIENVVTLLDEGFMPVDAIDDKQTEKLRRQLLAHLRI